MPSHSAPVVSDCACRSRHACICLAVMLEGMRCANVRSPCVVGTARGRGREPPAALLWCAGRTMSSCECLCGLAEPCRQNRLETRRSPHRHEQPKGGWVMRERHQRRLAASGAGDHYRSGTRTRAFVAGMNPELERDIAERRHIGLVKTRDHFFAVAWIDALRHYPAIVRECPVNDASFADRDGLMLKAIIADPHVNRGGFACLIDHDIAGRSFRVRLVRLAAF